MKNFPRGEATCGIADVLLRPRAGFLQALSLRLPELGFPLRCWLAGLYL